MLELNSFFFWQLVNFLILLFLLNTLLFKPFLRLFQERDRRISGSLDTAREMEAERDKLAREVEDRISGARKKAAEVFGELKTEGLSLQRSSLDEVSRETQGMNRKARADLEQETLRAKDSLRGNINDLSKIIVEKMIGT